MHLVAARPTIDTMAIWAIPTICIVWSLGLAATFWPGVLSNDSLEQISQGMIGVYTRNPPPLLAGITGRSMAWFKSPGPLIVLQLAALSLAMAFIASGGSWRSKALLIGFLITPTIWSVGITLWRDVVMAASLACAVAALYGRHPMLAIPFLLGALLVRHNAVVAILPLACYVAAAAAPSGYWAKLAAIAALLVALRFTVRLIERSFEARPNCPTCALLAQDLASVYLQRPEDFPNSLLSTQVSFNELAHAYFPLSASSLLYQCRPASWCEDMFWYPSPAAAQDNIRRCSKVQRAYDGTRCLSLRWLAEHRWPLRRELLRIIRREPVLYFRSKWERFLRLVGWGGSTVYYPFHVGVQTNWLGLSEPDANWLHRKLRALQEITRDGLFFRGWAWLMLATAELAYALFRRTPLPAIISASGVLYALSYFPFAPAADFRYLYWTVVGTFVSAAVAVNPDRSRPIAWPGRQVFAPPLAAASLGNDLASKPEKSLVPRR